VWPAGWSASDALLFNHRIKSLSEERSSGFGWARAASQSAHVRFLESIKSEQRMRRRESAMLVVAVLLYVLIGVLAMVPRSLLREEAILLIILVFLGFNVAWLLLYDSSAARVSNARKADGVQPATAAHDTGKG
jgi:hypothetical protein